LRIFDKSVAKYYLDLGNFVRACLAQNTEQLATGSLFFTKVGARQKRSFFGFSRGKCIFKARKKTAIW